MGWKREVIEEKSFLKEKVGLDQHKDGHNGGQRRDPGRDDTWETGADKRVHLAAGISVTSSEYLVIWWWWYISYLSFRLLARHLIRKMRVIWMKSTWLRLQNSRLLPSIVMNGSPKSLCQSDTWATQAASDKKLGHMGVTQEEFSESISLKRLGHSLHLFLNLYSSFTCNILQLSLLQRLFIFLSMTFSTLFSKCTSPLSTLS